MPNEQKVIVFDEFFVHECLLHVDVTETKMKEGKEIDDILALLNRAMANGVIVALCPHLSHDMNPDTSDDFSMASVLRQGRLNIDHINFHIIDPHKHLKISFYDFLNQDLEQKLSDNCDTVNVFDLHVAQFLQKIAKTLPERDKVFARQCEKHARRGNVKSERAVMGKMRVLMDSVGKKRHLCVEALQYALARPPSPIMVETKGVHLFTHGYVLSEKYGYYRYKTGKNSPPIGSKQTYFGTVYGAKELSDGLSSAARAKALLTTLKEIIQDDKPKQRNAGDSRASNASEHTSPSISSHRPTVFNASSHTSPSTSSPNKKKCVIV